MGGPAGPRAQESGRKWFHCKKDGTFKQENAWFALHSEKICLAEQKGVGEHRRGNSLLLGGGGAVIQARDDGGRDYRWPPQPGH